MINPNLQSLAKKIQTALGREDIKISLPFVRDAINKVSTDYANITTEQEQQIMDILKDKNNSQIESAFNSTDSTVVELSEQTIDNVVDDQTFTQPEPKEVNEQQDGGKLANTTPSAISFNDDFEKAITIKKELEIQNITLSRKEVFDISDNIGNDFESRDHMMFVIVDAIQQKENDIAEKYKNAIANILSNIHEKKAIGWKRSILMIQHGMQEINELDERGFDAVADILCAGFNLNKQDVLKGVIK